MMGRARHSDRCLTPRTAACWVGLAWGMLVAPRAAAQDMSPETEEYVRRSTVMVLMGMPGTSTSGSGTGQFINRNGLVLTNNHVVDPNHGKSLEERARDFHQVTLPEYRVVVDSGTQRERELPADLLHQSESGDLALLQVKDGKDQPLDTPYYLRFIPDGGLTADQKVWIFGFPGGRERSAELAITSGLITELIRSSSGAVTYVETDATVHPGNSGGPVVTIAGRLFGVATHKRFEQGAKDRSGAVPAPLVQQFIQNGFAQGRIPKSADLVPFTSVFTDHNGLVEFPAYERVDGEMVVHWNDGNIRRGTLQTSQLTAATALGRFDAPLERAAYLFVHLAEVVLIMDGGDRLAFPAGQASLAVQFAGRPETVALTDLKVVAFPRRSEPVVFPPTDGVVMESDECRLGLFALEGQMSVAGGRYGLAELGAIEHGKGQRVKVRTAKGEQIEGDLGRQAVRGKAVWSPGPVSLSFDTTEYTTIRPVQWAFVNARGRRLVERLDIKDEALIRIAQLLEGPDWQQAGALLEEAGKADRRAKDAKRQLELLEAVAKLRAGEFQAAQPMFDKLARKDDAVAWTAQCYASVLAEHPDGQFMSASLAEPDAMWRASSAAARRALAEVDTGLAGLEKLDYRKKAKALETLEQQVDIANRLELGIAQSKLMQILETAYFAHIAGYEETREEYNATVDEHNRAANRTQQSKYTRRLTSMEGRMKTAYAEIERIYNRLVKESAGFAVEPPKAGQ